MKNMEKWEIELRAKLNEELADGLYEFSNDRFSGYTGKQGKINMEVAWQKEIRKYTHPAIFDEKCKRTPRKKKKWIKKQKSYKRIYSASFNLEDFKKELYNFFTK